MLTTSNTPARPRRAAAVLVVGALAFASCGGPAEQSAPPLPAPTAADTTPRPIPPLLPPVATAAPTDAPPPPPVPVECGTAPVHGEPHRLEPADTDGDNIADTCVSPHDHPHPAVSEQPAVNDDFGDIADQAACETSGGTWSGTPPACYPPGEPTAAPEPTPVPSPEPVVLEPTPVSSPTPELLVCEPIEVHGEVHVTEPVDTDGDGAADTCSDGHDHPPPTPGEATIPADDGSQRQQPAPSAFGAADDACQSCNRANEHPEIAAAKATGLSAISRGVALLEV